MQRLATLALLVVVAPTSAAAPRDKAARDAVIGQPQALLAQPQTLILNGPRATRQIVVTGQYADGPTRDLTPFCDFTADAKDVFDVTSDGLARARRNGSTFLLIRAGGRTARVAVTVKDFDRPRPVSFRQDVIASLSVGGCSSGACHGTPTGKNGFKLSLRGYDPEADYLQLTRDGLGRRTFRGDADSSLIVLKAMGRVPHEGGQRFAPDSVAPQLLRGWLNEGLRDDAPDLPALQRLEVVPGSRLLRNPGRWQQLAVLAHFSDGEVRDVTRLTVFSSSDNAIADVSNTGLVEFSQVGEVAILCRYLDQIKSVRFSYLEPRPGFVWPNPPEHNFVDKHVFAKLKLLGIPPSDLCSDYEFIRRASLDLCAVLPTPEEVQKFLVDRSPDKRAKWIDALLARPEYADFWTLKWMDVLRGSRKTLGPKGAEVYRDWLLGQIQKNAPFDQVVRELLMANGNTHSAGPANYFVVVREPHELAEATAQVFLGVRMQCAKCHNHPFERWTQDDYYSLAAFFARVQSKTESGKKPNPKKPEAEVVGVLPKGEVTHPRIGKPAPPRFPGSVAASLPQEKDRREVLVEWLTAGDNPFFARSLVNRVWFHLTGRGIVEPVDDFRESNPPANDDLLDALAKDLVAHQYDVKHLIRTIMTSRTYQLSARTNPHNRDDGKYFSHAVTKLLIAEQMLDALSAVTEVPENYKGFPAGTRAVQLLDNEVNHPFLKTFGQPARDLPCECERGGEANLAQALQLINGATVHEKLTSPKNRLSRLLQKKMTDSELLTELYLATLSRPPRAGEAKAALEFVSQATDKRQAWEDVQWTLLNSKEFMFRH